MTAHQLSVFVKNVPGEFANVCRAIAKKGAYIAAFSGSAQWGTGVIHLAFKDRDIAAARDALKEGGWAFSEAEVLAAVADDKVGAAAELLEKLAEASVNVTEVYTNGADGGKILFIVYGHPYETAKEVLAKHYG